jgi:hypothetical protein
VQGGLAVRLLITAASLSTLPLSALTSSTSRTTAKAGGLAAPVQLDAQRLVSALLAEQDEEWMTAKIYLTVKP